MRASAPHSPRRPWGYETHTPFHHPAPRSRSRRRNRAGGGVNRAPALAPAPDRPTPRPGAGASLRARLGMGALLLIDRPLTRGGSGSGNRKRTLSSSVGVRAEPCPALTLGAMKHTRPFIARRPGPGVAGETAPRAGANRAPALAPAPDRPALDQELALPYGRGSEWAPCS